MNTESNYLTFDEAAEFLNISKHTLYSHTSKRTVPHYKVGKFVRFKKEDLVEWMEERKREPKKQG